MKKRIQRQGVKMDKVGHCPKVGKAQYPDRETAMKARKFLRKATGAKTKPYICPFCKLWHIGHRRRRK